MDKSRASKPNPSPRQSVKNYDSLVVPKKQEAELLADKEGKDLRFVSFEGKSTRIETPNETVSSTPKRVRPPQPKQKKSKKESKAEEALKFLIKNNPSLIAQLEEFDKNCCPEDKEVVFKTKKNDVEFLKKNFPKENLLRENRNEQNESHNKIEKNRISLIDELVMKKIQSKKLTEMEKKYKRKKPKKVKKSKKPTKPRSKNPKKQIKTRRTSSRSTSKTSLKMDLKITEELLEKNQFLNRGNSSILTTGRLRSTSRRSISRGKENTYRSNLSRNSSKRDLSRKIQKNSKNRKILKERSQIERKYTRVKKRTRREEAKEIIEKIRKGKVKVRRRGNLSSFGKEEREDRFMSQKGGRGEDEESLGTFGSSRWRSERCDEF